MRGLKYWETIKAKAGELVAPFAGAWIEIDNPEAFDAQAYVAPFAGAWIEIT